VAENYLLVWQPRVKDCLEVPWFEPVTLRFPPLSHDHLHKLFCLQHQDQFFLQVLFQLQLELRFHLYPEPKPTGIQMVFNVEIINIYKISYLPLIRREEQCKRTWLPTCWYFSRSYCLLMLFSIKLSKLILSYSMCSILIKCSKQIIEHFSRCSNKIWHCFASFIVILFKVYWLFLLKNIIKIIFQYLECLNILTFILLVKNLWINYLTSLKTLCKLSNNTYIR